MFQRNKSNENSNFWISYADLMAGLLFVFILLIGAIVSKSFLLRTELLQKDTKLHKLSDTLKDKDKLFEEKNKIIDINTLKLSELKEKVQEQSNTIFQAKVQLESMSKKEKENKKNIQHLKMLLSKERISQKELNNTLKINKNILDKIVIEKNEKVLGLTKLLNEKNIKYNNLVLKSEKQKTKIKSLTGIKLQVISELKKTLGEKIQIDKKSGALQLNSSILFNSGKSSLRPEAKLELKKTFEKYVRALISNKNIKSHLDKIIIEGHTDSDGGYLYNLKLSQNRALAVMQYLVTLDFKNNNIKPLLVASGRAYLDPILKNGKEDKKASRRIEIKFRLKNDDAMHEIEEVLDAK